MKLKFWKKKGFKSYKDYFIQAAGNSDVFLNNEKSSDGDAYSFPWMFWMNAGWGLLLYPNFSRLQADTTFLLACYFRQGSYNIINQIRAPFSAICILRINHNHLSKSGYLSNLLTSCISPHL